MCAPKRILWLLAAAVVLLSCMKLEAQPAADLDRLRQQVALQQQQIDQLRQALAQQEQLLHQLRASVKAEHKPDTSQLASLGTDGIARAAATTDPRTILQTLEQLQMRLETS